MAEISLTSLFGKLNSTSYRALEAGTAFCKTRGNPHVELSHITSPNETARHVVSVQAD